MKRLLWCLAWLFPLLVGAADGRVRSASLPWWKGNLHTHTLWSDGDAYPEMVVDWYREHGYHFLAISDHNILLNGDKWIGLKTNAASGLGFTNYLQRFGSGVDFKRVEGKVKVRLKTFAELSQLFAQPGRFLLLPSEEISDEYKKLPIHLNATNLREFIKPQHGTNVLDVIQRNVDAVLAQRDRTGQWMFPHLNHPNFGWAVTAEDIAPLQGDRFFEVYNGHPMVHNRGDATHASMERVWDIILTERLAKLGLDPLFGLAVDDAHNYQEQGIKQSNPGRGWLMVQAAALTPAELVQAMERGDFYASTGVQLRTIVRDAKGIRLEILGERDVEYTTQFIGTRRGYDSSSRPVVDKKGKEIRSTRIYSDQIGQVFEEDRGMTPWYRFRGDEVYVRAKITSNKPKLNPYAKGEMETAWIQPVVVKGETQGQPLQTLRQR